MKRRSNISLRARLSRIRLLVFDVDGVLTDGTIQIDSRGGESKTFGVRDGFAIARAVEQGIRVAFVSGRSSRAVAARARELGVDPCVQNCRDKREQLRRLQSDFDLEADEVAFVGDDLNDLSAFAASGVKIAVSDAVKELREHADWVTDQRGGYGAAREVTEAVLRAKGLWGSVVESYTASAAGEEAPSERRKRRMKRSP